MLLLVLLLLFFLFISFRVLNIFIHFILRNLFCIHAFYVRFGLYLSYVDIGHGQSCLKNDKWTGTIPYICTCPYTIHLVLATCVCYICISTFKQSSGSVNDSGFSCHIHLFYFFLSFFLLSIEFFLYYSLLCATSWFENLTKKCLMNKILWNYQHDKGA